MLSGFSFSFISCIMILICIIYVYYYFFMRSKVLHVNSKEEVRSIKGAIVPTSVNYHFTRKCNYQCGFCFHTALNSYVLPMGDAEKGLTMLRDAGMEKINFSGGEPFFVDSGDYLGKLVKFCKIKLQLPSVSIVSNGSLIRESWFKKYGEYLDIMAISCDSFIENTNKLIGRASGKSTKHIKKMAQIRDWCITYRVAFKINTVVNTYNVNEDMAQNIALLDPVRWKVFQCLLLEGENVGPNALKNAEKFYISNQEFQKFLDLHSHIKCLVPESNVKMQNSYLILDERMRFLDCREGTKKPSLSILDVGVESALDQSGFDEKMFRIRGGLYKWSKRDLIYDW